MKGGKFDDSVLKELIFNNIKHKRKEVILGSGTGIDSSIIDIGKNLVVVTTDPITASVHNIGHLCVNICCNDIAAAGAEPVAIFITMLMPYEYDTSNINKILKEIDTQCAKLNIQLAGGHTEKTDAVTRLVLCATAIGRKDQLKKAKVTAGDVLLMTKSAALEGASIIAHDYEDKIKNLLDENQINFLKNMISYISVVEEGKIATENNAKYMHDVTEGGVLGAAWEMTQVTGCNLELYCDNIFIYDEIKILCENFDIDPLRLISSGSMLIAADKNDAKVISDGLKSRGIKSTEIGKFIEGEKSIYIRKNKIYELKEPGEDEIYKI